MAKYSPNDPCPCHSGRKYKKCCRPYHAGKNPPQPVDLVRARYAAYALGDTEFIMRTTHPDSKSYNPNREQWLARINSFMFMTLFEGLTIISAEDDRVHFNALLVTPDSERHVAEVSTFKQIDGVWYYYSAQKPSETDDITEIDETSD